MEYTKAQVREKVTMSYDDDAIRTNKKEIMWNPKNGNFSNKGEYHTRVLLIVGANPKKEDDEITLGASLQKVQLRFERNKAHKFYNVFEEKFVENPLSAKLEEEKAKKKAERDAKKESEKAKVKTKKEDK